MTYTRVTCFIGLAIFLSLSFVSPPARKSSQYNVLFIAIDDLNDWTSFLKGHPQTLTPNMDRLAAQGMIFDNAHCAAPVCNPSRTAVLSGYRPSTSGIYGNSQFFRDSPVLSTAIFLPKWFSNNGYYAEARGKILHHSNGKWADPQSWDFVSEDREGNFGKLKTQKGLGANKTDGGSVDLDWGATENEAENTPDYMNAQWAAAQLTQTQSKPFFIACGIFRPHLPWYVPQKYFDRFSLDDIQLPVIKEDDLDDVPETGKDMSGGLRPNSDYQQLKKIHKEKEAVRAYLACISYADDCIGVIMDALEKSPYKDNTIVVLWGDHGWHLGEKLHYRKVTLWERATRVPLIVKVPGMTKPGVHSNRTVSLLDLYPTLLELCRLPANPANEGRSFVPVLKNSTIRWARPAVTTMGQNQHTVRNERYRYIHYKDGSEELYDHQSDPNEWKNEAKNPAYAAIKKEMATWLPKVNAPETKKSGKGSESE